MTNRILAAGFVAVVLSIWGSAWYIKQELGAYISFAAGDIVKAVHDGNGSAAALPGRAPLNQMLIDEAARRGQQ